MDAILGLGTWGMILRGRSATTLRWAVMPTTSDPNDPRLHGPNNQLQEAYLVLSAEERAKGFVRPVRREYVHTVCETVTRMSQPLAETYAVNPKFYGSTRCMDCHKHCPVEEFKWVGTDEVVGS